MMFGHNPRRILKLIKTLQRYLILKTKNVQSKLEIFTQLQLQKESIPSALAFLVMKTRKNIQSMYQNNVVQKNILTYY